MPKRYCYILNDTLNLVWLRDHLDKYGFNYYTAGLDPNKYIKLPRNAYNWSRAQILKNDNVNFKVFYTKKEVDEYVRIKKGIGKKLTRFQMMDLE